MSDIIQPEHQWFKLSSIVDTACGRLGISVNHYFQRLLGFAKWELIQLKIDRANEVKTVLLPVSDNFVVQVPSDCLDYVKVGVPDGQFVKTIGVNAKLMRLDRSDNQISFSRSFTPGMIPNGTSIESYTGNFVNYGGRALPTSGGGLPQEGHFQFVSRSGYKEILLDGNLCTDEIYLEYVGLGINPCGETIVNPSISDYLLKKVLEIYEEEIEPKATEASIERRKRASAEAFIKVSGRTNSVSPDDLYNIVRAAVRLTPHS